ncbi:MAG: GYF domain-containing protein [Planctomycetota bacterium]|nr:GYF domain-containing protein [Planctomycetota bacterium]
MPIEFICSGCRTLLRVSASSGDQARCPRCGVCEPFLGTDYSETSTEATSWLRGPDQQVYGPCSLSEVQAWVLEGRIGDEFQIRHGNDDSWRSLRIQIWNDSDLPSGAAQAATKRPHRAGRILMLGSASLLCFPPLSIVAWFTARRDLVAMYEGTMDPRGRGATLAGMNMGVLSVVWQLYLLAEWIPPIFQGWLP